MIEVVACDVDGAELPELGRRFHDRALPEILIDDAVYDFVRFTEPGVALYRRRSAAANGRSGAQHAAVQQRIQPARRGSQAVNGTGVRQTGS